ncbi:hypothetical protein SAMN02745866_03190 [Alteromonadaceae bacterium Bs31]|nr:hypothetical protein SAMN02745866_03190 [Alteromonadaceae bacterium Bs31]
MTNRSRLAGKLAGPPLRRLAERYAKGTINIDVNI